MQDHIKRSLASGPAAAQGTGGFQLPEAPQVDFSKFGETEIVELGRIKKISGAHLHRAWLNIPHVTQFDEADITELEAFRKESKQRAENAGIKLTFMPFLMKACANALRAMPEFNSSLAADGESLVLKKYFHIGVAVDTPSGRMVPVVRDVDQKGVFDLAADLMTLSGKARAGKLSPADMQGGCLSISSLGGIGGTQFTPIVNAPEVAILGVGRAKMQPVVREGEIDDRFYIIVAGKVEVQANGTTIGTLTNGDCFGETSYVRGAKRQASIRAEGQVTILRVSSTLMEQVSSACQLRFNKVFLRSLITRLQGSGGANT